MTDRDTREKILRDNGLPIHRPYRGVNNTKDSLELLLMGYSKSEIQEELGIPRSTLESSLKRLREDLGYNSCREMVRGLVISARGYL